EARRIAGYIGEYPALLFLDNFEQLVPEGITLVQSLAESCPRLKVVVTSRERLDIGFDHELPLAPLSAPDASDLADRIAEMPSVQLFLDRASQAGAPLTLTEGTASDIAAICRKLEGIPLALVLAGARARMLGPRQMLDALEDRFAVLATKRRDLPERQRTLGASIRWSYQLLPDYKHFFACLGVFRGGFTMESAAAVACSDAEEPLRHLVDCSLVIFRPTDKRPRFGMLETIREFAESRLHGGTLREVRSNHARFFAELAQKATAEALTPKQQEWIATLAEEEANIREALRWSIENDPNVALRLVDGLWFYWNAGANWREARDWLSAAVSLATGETDPIDLARAYQGLGAMERRLGNLEAARNALRKSVEIYQAAGERRLIARPLNSLGVLELGEGNFDEAEKYFAEALQIVEEAGDDRLVAMVQANLGDLDVRLNRLEEAKSHLETALSLNRKTSNRVWEASNLATLAEIAEASSDCESALRLLDESLTIQDDLDLPRSATTLKTKGLVLARMQRSDEALQTMREEAKCLDESGDAKGLAACLARAADLLDSLGEAERANALRAIDDSNARAFAELIFPSDEISR
ncbi:MAG TPA: tetratricopeptide repeat protein, partial [Fimbriimonadales bacterium]|nr:tetratricopeptide repeat protein [Fimbriimonadales bacterium]